MIANIARYHRKSPPKSSHIEFIVLSEEQQEKVIKLAAVLRIAIALDRSHKGQITDLDIKIKNDAVVIRGKSRGDISMEVRDFELKKDLIDRLLKKPVVLI